MGRIRIIQGDITTLEVDAIVNAANSSLLGGGGVDGAIHRAGGNELQRECRTINKARSSQPGGACPPGEAVITGAGRLGCKKVIHTVGPVWRGGAAHEDQVLASCYRNCLALAVREDLAVIAFPNISTGVYGYPMELAAGIAWKTVSEHLEKAERPREVIFVCYNRENYELYRKLAGD
jgi:O-acetyl-ADP-ribose deacetylase (regulator of RNase III)